MKKAIEAKITGWIDEVRMKKVDWLRLLRWKRQPAASTRAILTRPSRSSTASGDRRARAVGKRPRTAGAPTAPATRQLPQPLLVGLPKELASAGVQLSVIRVPEHSAHLRGSR